MVGLDEKDRFRAQMFEDSNRLRFERPVDDVGRQWWLAKFFEPHEITPEIMGDLLTNSLTSEKSILYHYIDGANEAFSIRIGGALPCDQGIWFVQRSLELRGAIFNADEMFISPAGQQSGRGRRLMGDLIDTAKKIGVDTIKIEAQKIGRYAWLKMGFLPDGGSWRMLQADAARAIQRYEGRLGRKLASDLVRQVLVGTQETARILAGLRQMVPSRERFDEWGHPEEVPLGIAIFLENNMDWYGTFDLRDEGSLKVADDYLRQGRRC
jgi:GNAT superfamily N-acetyltransferase